MTLWFLKLGLPTNPPPPQKKKKYKPIDHI
jgi:hypothetical protein